MKITIVATGFEKKFDDQPAPAKKEEPRKAEKAGAKKAEPVAKESDDLDFDDLFSVFRK
jgi:hypothetical protein